jgi:hypothetical protein
MSTSRLCAAAMQASYMRNVELLVKEVAHEQEWLPELARQILQVIVDQLQNTIARIREIELRLTR